MSLRHALSVRMHVTRRRLMLWNGVPSLWQRLPAMPRPSVARRRLFEQLETRCVLSCTVVIDPLTNTLIITGDDKANHLDVQDMLAGGVTATCDGEDLNAKYNQGQPWFVTGVTINTLGGDDQVSYTCGGPGQPITSK